MASEMLYRPLTCLMRDARVRFPSARLHEILPIPLGSRTTH
jgi:hypothetical protein